MFGGKTLEIKSGYAYHVKDIYFDLVKDPCLMQNKERGSYRPTLYCIKDKNTDILWMVPISSQYKKFKDIHDKIIAKGKPCRGIVLGEYAGQKAAFLLQNMFPIKAEYINHIHTKNGNPVPVNYKLRARIQTNMKTLLAMNSRGIKVTFTDINNLMKLL